MYPCARCGAATARAGIGCSALFGLILGRVRSFGSLRRLSLIRAGSLRPSSADSRLLGQKGVNVAILVGQIGNHLLG